MIGMNKIYTLPNLPYGYKDLEPYMSEGQLKIHHQKHHQAYVNAANALLEKIEKARTDNTDLDVRAISRDLSFNVGGHVLHSLFWENLAPADKKSDGQPEGTVLKKILDNFNSFERFKKEFTQLAITVEGSGWATLLMDQETNRLFIGQIEKHNVNLFPNSKIIFALDVFEHSYYIDYKNDRAKFVENSWNLINWNEVEKRIKTM